MNAPGNPVVKYSLIVLVGAVVIFAARPIWQRPTGTNAANADPAPGRERAAAAAARPSNPTTNDSASAATNVVSTNAVLPNAPVPGGAVAGAVAAGGGAEGPGRPPGANVMAAAEGRGAVRGPEGGPPGATNPPPTRPGEDGAGTSEEVQLSFQGADVDMVIQWLAKTTGKSVVKHPRVQCQVTIVSSKKVSAREAINLVYRALGLEGFSAIETENSIMIVPEGQEPKTSPQLIGSTRTDLPEGRQRLMKIFPLANVPASEIRDKIRPMLSEKATVELSDRANQIIVTDYTESIQMVAELIKQLDLPTAGDTVIEFFTLKHSEAEDLGNLLTLVLNAQSPPPSAPGSPSRTSGPGRAGPQMPPGVVMEAPPGMPPGAGGPAGAAASGGANPQVRIWPDKTSNRLIVAAQKSKLPEIQRLIDLLDTEKPRDVTIRVLPLKNMTAEDLVRELGPLFQKMGGKSAKEIIEVSGNSRANSLVVLSSEANYKAIERLVAALDTEEAQEKIMRAFQLKNAEAEEVAKQLQDLNQDQDSTSRYPFFIFNPGMGGRGSKKPTFVADRRRNTVIVQVAPAQMDNIAKLIEELDEPVSDASLAPKIYRLKYVSATDIEDVLNELFLKRQQQRTYWDPYGMPTREVDQQGTGRLAGKVRITSEPYSNSLIVTANSAEHLAAVEEVLQQLDSPSQAGESTLRVGLRFAKASTVANSINILFAKGGAPPLRAVGQPGQPGNVAPQQQQQQNIPSRSGFDLEQEAKEEGYFPWLGGQPDVPRTADGRAGTRPVSDLVGRVRVVADQRSNALLISANVHYFPQLIKLIDELDARTDQVLIEARLIEVSSNFLDKLGVRWSPDGSQVFTADDYDNSFLARATAQYQKGFGEKTLVNTPSSGAVGQALASLRSGVLSSTMSMDFLVQFLKKTTDATVLAEPQINIRDNETGRLFVGQQVPIPDNTQVSQLGGQNTSIRYKDVGVVLEVTPHINSSGDVELRIHAESSTVVPGQTVLGGALFDTRNFRTDLTAKDGQTLVLGGIIQKQVSDTLRKTPILGSLPGLGWAFKKKDKTMHEVELMVFLRPRVIRTPEGAQELLEEIGRKTPLIKNWEERLQQSDKKREKELEEKKKN